MSRPKQPQRRAMPRVLEQPTPEATAQPEPPEHAAHEGYVTAAQGGKIDISGSSFDIPDIGIKRGPGTVRLKTRSTITAALSLLNERGNGSSSTSTPSGFASFLEHPDGAAYRSEVRAMLDRGEKCELEAIYEYRPTGSSDPLDSAAMSMSMSNFCNAAGGGSGSSVLTLSNLVREKIMHRQYIA